MAHTAPNHFLQAGDSVLCNVRRVCMPTLFGEVRPPLLLPPRLPISSPAEPFVPAALENLPHAVAVVDLAAGRWAGKAVHRAAGDAARRS